MASSDNVTIEKPIDFEDGEYDPDLEVRLYAEIYYSNETYVPDYESSIPNDKTTPNVALNAQTTLPSKQSLVSNESVTDGIATSANTENQLPTNNFVEDLTPGNDIDHRQNSDVGTSYYPKSDWVFGEVSKSTGNRETIEQQPVCIRSAGKRQRQLAQKGLWLTPENTERDGSAVGRPNITPIHKEIPTADSHANDPTVADRLSTNGENDLIRNDSCTQDNNKRKRKQKNLKKNGSKQVYSKKPLSRYNAANDTGVTVETDKYKVVSKKKKMRKKKRNPAPLVISSDSEDSIVEVPVPPKPPPLIIQLPDSEDDCDPSDNDGSKKTKKSPVKKTNASASYSDLPTDSLVPDASSKSPVTESNPSKTYEISSEATRTVRDIADVSVEPVCPDGNALILNCTEIQRGTSSLDEIRKMSKTGPSINTHSDDSMTESEANNWINIAAGQLDATRDQDVSAVDLSNETVNIAAGQSNATRDREICSVDLSMEAINIELWNQTRHKNSTSAGIPTEIPFTSGDGTTVDRTVANKEKTLSVSVMNKEVAGVRKRQKETGSRPFTDFDVPAIPLKRSKRLKDKAMTEYFFKPMSNELQAFYNNPWGGENMNVYDIQSRMPENPRCWGILDVDLQGPTSKRRRACPRCNTDSHIGRSCPEKAKTACCYMCGAKGHIESRCPHKMCLTCGRKYATYRPTCDYCCKLYCSMCNGLGHSNENCPDLWRRYHNTTTETIPIAPRDPLNIMKAPQYLWCCNCGRRGHDVTTCQQLRWSQHFPTPMSVSSYTEGPFYESSNRGQIQYESSNRGQMQYESSNREQMQYESSNREQIQYESSNREQMQYESSNHEQMQCESSNREQMQYELSNREQMQYESSNREQMQYALPNEDWIHDVPHDGRIGYPNPNTDPIYVPQHQERFQNTTPSKDIEVIEVYDNPEASITEPTNSVPSSNVIFESGDTFLPGKPFLRSASRRLDKVKNIHLNGLLNGRLKPMFLLTWNKIFEFRLRITREPNNIVRMIIEATSPVLLKALEKLMMQWLMRSDDEKPNLEYDIFPYGDVNGTIESIRRKKIVLRTVPEPTILWKKIVACEEQLKNVRAKNSRCTNQKKAARKRYAQSEMAIICNTIKRRSQLVTSLYSHSWVDGGEAVVRSFKEITTRQDPPKRLPLHHYLELIYLNNELFTFHTSEALSKALEKAILESRPSESITAPIAEQPSVDTSVDVSSTEAVASVEVCEKNNSTIQLLNQPTVNNNSLSAGCSPLTPHREQQVTVIEDMRESPQIPKVFSTTDAGNKISLDTNDGTGIASHTVWNPLFRPGSVKGIDSQNAVQTPASFQRKVIEPGGLKDTRAIQLRNLTKRNRKLYRNSAKQAIKLANSTNMPHLQEMAKALKVKSGNGTITTEDVDRLRAAIGPHLNRRITRMQESQRIRESFKDTNDNAYKKFLKSL